MLMKKFITLLLVLTGMVLTASADSKTIYVQNTRAWSAIYLYEWDGEGPTTAWPGDQKCVRKIIQSDWYFKVTVTKANFQLNDGGSTQTDDLTLASIEDGAYYWIWDNNKGITKMDAPTATYTYNISSTTAGETLYNLYLYHGSDALSGSWPGAFLIAEGGEYNLTYGTNTDLGEIKVIFKGNGSKQTCDLWANPGDNNYYIASLASSKLNESWGEGVKTNGSGYATYVTYNPLTIPENIAYYATDNNNGSATAHNITHPAASTPMLIKGTANTIYHFAPLSDGTNYSSTNAFYAGSGAALESGSGPFNYILNGNTFYLANGQYVATNKAYLALSVAATARPLIFEDEDVTAIKAVSALNSENNAYFNIAGQRVAQPTKGLYIVNGKKVIIK